MVNKAVHFNLMMNSKVDKEGTGTQWNTAKCGCERVFVIATYAAWYWEVEKKSCQRDNDPHHLTKHTRLSLLPKIPSHFYSSILLLSLNFFSLLPFPLHSSSLTFKLLSMANHDGEFVLDSYFP